MTRLRARRLKGALVVGVVLSSGAACSFVTSFDGLTTGGSDAGAAYNGTFGGEDSGRVIEAGAAGQDDGSVIEPEDATPGTGEDASLPDAGPTPDAASDGAAGDGGRYCASLVPAPLFCADFDESSLPAPWDQVTKTGGTVTLTSKEFTSSPFSMLVTSSAGASAIDLAGYKSFAGAATTKTYTLSFDIDVLQADVSATTSDAILAAIQLDQGSRPAWDLQLEVSYDTTKGALGVNLSENASFTDGGHLYTPHRTSATLPIGAWTRVSMVVVRGSTDAALLALGGTNLVSIVVNPGVVSAYPEILVGGAFAEKSAQGWIVSYDDVTFDAQ